MSPSPDAAPASATVDRMNVREALENYFHGLDARDEERLANCFAIDAEARHHAGSDSEFIVRGNAEIARHFCAMLARFQATTHCACNCVVRIDGDTAHASTFAIAYVADTQQVRTRGLRYLDDLVRTPDGWRIRRRTHIQLWQYEAASVQPHLPR